MRKILPTEWLSKDEVAARFARYPALEKLVLVLLYDWRFRLTALALVLVAVGFGLVLAPVWRVTPPGFEPVQRVKLLDRWQAHSLLRTARAEIAAGRTADGLMTMRAAVGNNPGDLELVREFAEQIRLHGDPRRQVHMAVQNGLWLIRLSSTNTADLELVTDLFERFLLDDLVVSMLEPLEDELSPALERTYIKALFMNRDFTRFTPRMTRLEAQGRAALDPEVKLLHAAYVAGWTDGISARLGQDELEQAKGQPELGLLAHRLQLIVSERRKDVSSYGVALDNVLQRAAARLIDHLIYWRLLTESGQREKAVELIRSNVHEPRSGDEAILLAKSYYEFGLPDEARTVLHRYARHFAVAGHLWLSLGNLLMTQEKWSDLGQVALEIRDETNPSRNELLAMSLYFEGMAELKQHRDTIALEAFQKAAQAPCESEPMLLQIASGMSDAGQPGPAQQLLLNNREVAENSRDFWNLLGKVSFELRDLPTLAYAAARTHSLTPDDPGAIQNHAAALLSMRTMPQEAIALTLEFYARHPNRAGALLNHAAALAQNNRFAEARRLLQRVEGVQLSESERSTFNLVSLEVNLAEGHHAEALEAAARIERSSLFPPEIQWLDSALKRLTTNQPPESPTPSR